MKEENFDPIQSTEIHTDYAITTDENYEEQGFLWMCGICQDGPTFETVYDLFHHKKLQSHLFQAKRKTKVTTCTTDSDLQYDSLDRDTFELVDRNEESIASDSERTSQDLDIQTISSKSLPEPSPTSSDDIPLANLTAKFNVTLNKDKNTQRNNKNSGVKKYRVKTDSESENVTKKRITCDNNKTKQDEISCIDSSDKINLNKEENIKNCNTKVYGDGEEIENEIKREQKVDIEGNILNWKNNSTLNNTDIQAKEIKLENLMKLKVRHICKICNSEFSSRFALSVHKKTHLYKDTGCYRCETCGKMCPKYDNFTRHLTIHFENREKSHQCNHCFASFYNLADLKRHLVLHLSVKPFTCEHCGEGFTRQDSLLIHAYKHTGVLYMKYACKDCDKVLNSQSALVMHVKTHSVKTVFCPEPGCKFSCYLQSQLRQHVRKHSGEKPFQCAKCGRCFARSNDMKNHVLNVHEGVRPFKCPACLKDFALVGNLRIHYTTHTNERPYLCAQCGKSFNHPSTLRKHSVTVHSPWRNQDKQSRSRRIPSIPQSPLSQRNLDLKKNKGRRKEILTKDVAI